MLSDRKTGRYALPKEGHPKLDVSVSGIKGKFHYSGS